MEEIKVELPDKTHQIKEDRKIQAENMRLKKRIYELEKELDNLNRFIGGV